MADPRSLWRSRRVQGRRPEAESEESSYNLTPLQRFRPVSFTIDPKARDSELPAKRHRTKLLSVKERSDSLEDDWIDSLPS